MVGLNWNIVGILAGSIQSLPSSAALGDSAPLRLTYTAARSTAAGWKLLSTPQVAGASDHCYFVRDFCVHSAGEQPQLLEVFTAVVFVTNRDQSIDLATFAASPI